MNDEKAKSKPSDDLTVEELAEQLVKNDRLLGLDLGTKTIGLALSDTMRVIATPMQTLVKGKFKVDAAKLLSLIETHQIGGLVLGMPRNLNGTEGPRAQSTRAFARNLSARTNCPILFWDERLSTVAVERTLLEADATRKRRAEVIDKMAAAFILQGVLDRLKHLDAEHLDTEHL